MAKKLCIVLSVLGMSVVGLTIVGAQAPATPRPGGGGGGFGGPGGPPTPAEMTERMIGFMGRMLDDMSLSESEKQLALDSIKTKMEARSAVQEQLNKLREVADDQKATDPQIAAALNTFIAAQTQYNKVVSNTDAALVKKISLRTRARLTLMGVVENGVGFGGGGAMFFRGKGGPGGGFGGGGFRRERGKTEGGQ